MMKKGFLLAGCLAVVFIVVNACEVAEEIGRCYDNNECRDYEEEDSMATEKQVELDSLAIRSVSDDGLD
ncbi:MAG: hypothetical protein GY931_17900 [Maribacter sp.]|nr:hypothetical protein [Maribacter sp.]